ncbi:MAG TPA: Lpg1974 family pore-forming outer membrane protein [Gemmataceae bacterium]|nr:Lpg1974 family pore-forming outer membrane protein [Gemmataceae bacterium]
MVHKVRGPLMVAVLGVWVWIDLGRCRADDLPPAPVAVASNPALGPLSLSGPPPPAAACVPPDHGAGPPACAPYEDCNGPLLRGDPLLDRPEYPQPGWFATLEMAVVASHVKNGLTAGVTVDGLGTDQVQLPTAGLDWTGAPQLELGYRLAEGMGELLFSYHSVQTDGSTFLPGFDLDGGTGVLNSRLDVHVIDLDYASREYALGPRWDMKWNVGLRLASVLFESRATGFFLEQRAKNDFWGAGPHAGLQLWRSLDVPGLALYGKIEGAAVLGDIKQTFEEDIATGGGLVGGVTAQQTDQAVPVINAQLGVAWTPGWHGRRLRFAGGYEIEQWWYLGQVGDSRAELTVQGLFLRGEWGY